MPIKPCTLGFSNRDNSPKKAPKRSQVSGDTSLNRWESFSAAATIIISARTVQNRINMGSDQNDIVITDFAGTGDFKIGASG